MYLHLGQDQMVPYSQIIGIFDLDNASLARSTRDYLRRAQQKDEIIPVSADLPRTFVVCAGLNKKNQRVYLSPISTATLLKRVARWRQITGNR